MLQTSEKFGAVAEALAKAQVEIENATKDRANEHFKSKYATLAAVLDASRPMLAKHGIALLQAAGNGADGEVVVETRLIHSSGEWLASVLSVRPMKADAQGIGSAITYLRRYALSALVGITQDDDDGNAASAVGKPQAQAPAVDEARERRKKIASKLNELSNLRVWHGLDVFEGDKKTVDYSEDELIKTGKQLQARLTWVQFDELAALKHPEADTKADAFRDPAIAVLTEAEAAEQLANLKAQAQAGA